ncbi:GNAT family N-acetyltransferase [Phaeobacter gallaeciensis]|uniref:Acetyltransferase domain-containing protein n=1 Tax=Phaeobacter gallaeciensis TaxID=60890 RepID=A0AAD0EDF2_9RHOB|nr:GNAT family N-acetyltransferase [Phaeobacter gallaeciensis]AHD10087.1 Acetyltransferase [Phaeobacter gallaeciensis DSM 26640]ATE93351.1 acetyltransferase domain-containing protein [Phaeobacter gallaeciensis]ATE96828.1 acetyltransferase domain-containing protein [Phaeobacter gallaeciensis]ATF02015.1 acetyltransferase domain-containing protein [Phaeobacter gallaeciensis]ATF06395.1 acetyltransferase domain-containing protein [Phaeobacter gallaeciensis]
MSAALHLARPEDLDRVLDLAAAFHSEMGITSDDTLRRAAIEPLLEGLPYGAVYLIGPARAPVGYIVVTFSWSVEFGGMDGFVDELFIRPPVRGRGIATEVLFALPRTLAEAGIKALHLEVDKTDDTARNLYARARFEPREKYMLMSRKL